MNKRILFITNSGSLGGASLDLLSLLGRLPVARIEPVVVVAEDGPFNAKVEALGVRTVRVEQPWWVTSGTVDAWLYSMRLLPKAVESIRSIIRKEDITAVVTNVSVIPAGALAAAIEEKPHLWIVREFVGQGGFLGPLDTTMIHGCMGALSVCVVCVSETLAAVVREKIGGEKIAVVHSGIETGRFSGCTPDHDSQAIVSIGATTPEKGLDDLVEAAGILIRKGSEFSVRVVGDFDHLTYRAKVERRLKFLGIQQCFQFTGFQTDTRPSLHRVAIYCSPSHTEGMGMTIVEAMSAGLPVVATDSGGPRDLVEEGKTGMLVPVKKPEALAEALREVLTNPKLAASMGEAGRKRARQRFDVDTTVPLMVEQLERVLMAKPDKAVAPLARWLVQLLSIGGPRILLGKKLKLFQFLESLGR
ncbi:MAG: hypothetical protein A2X49_09190 [Lentisphaerae bacterium GWF2_52_8]|nr:MAG: hypothetical protein A2X49_09190 [Lentisphaerae bacterium GWF2_52_8]